MLAGPRVNFGGAMLLMTDTITDCGEQVSAEWSLSVASMNTIIQTTGFTLKLHFDLVDNYERLMQSGSLPIRCDDVMFM